MKITLIIDGKPKTFEQNFVSGRMLRRTIEYEAKFKELLDAVKVDDDYDMEKYDRLKDLELASEYVAEVFNRQFTADDYMDGIESHKLVPEFLRIKTQVQTGRAEALETDEKND